MLSVTLLQKNPLRILHYFSSKIVNTVLDLFNFKQFKMPLVSVFMTMHKRINMN